MRSQCVCRKFFILGFISYPTVATHTLSGGMGIFVIVVIMGVTFDSKMTFEKHLRSVSTAASQRLGILRKSWRVFHDRALLGRCFRGFVLPVLEYCSAVWCLTADTHLKLLDRAVSGARFLTGVCLCVTFLIVDPWQSCVCFIRSGVTWYTLLMVLSLDRMSQRGLHAVLWSHIGALIPPRCRTLQYSRTFIPFSVSLWNDLANPVFDGVGQAGFKSRVNASLLA